MLIPIGYPYRPAIRLEIAIGNIESITATLRALRLDLRENRPIFMSDRTIRPRSALVRQPDMFHAGIAATDCGPHSPPVRQFLRAYRMIAINR